MRSIKRLPRLSASMANINTLTPGLRSGESFASIIASIPASHLQPMTDVAKPVIDCAAAMAHSFVSAVMMTRLPYILKASAKVSTIVVDLIFMMMLYLWL